jgi:hypothetical protein
MLFLGLPINGPVLGGIFTISGFAAVGKTLKNSAPILLGSAIAAYINYHDPRAPLNVLAILFSTGLAPIASKYGWFVGILIGIIHVAIAHIVGDLNGGLNLYNNGFAGGLVAITIVPLIDFFREFYKKPK